MKKNENVWQDIWEKIKIVFAAIGKVFSVIGMVFRKIGRFIFLIRKLLLAVPVVLGLVYVIGYVKERLPSQVGLLIQESGAYTYIVEQGTALNFCVVVTAVCLLLMFISRRTVYPWLISIFSLILPVALLLTNIFPA